MRYNLLIPLADGRKIAYDTLYGIMIQKVEVDIIPVSRPEIRVNRENGVDTAKTINLKILLQYASKPYTFIMDNDVCPITNEDFSACIRFLDRNPEYDAVSLDTKNIEFSSRDRKHVCIAFTCLRYDGIKKINFDKKEHLECLCSLMSRSIKMRYLNDMRLKEI